MQPAGRRKSLIFPREHGDWGILVVPLITGSAAGLLAGGNPRSITPLGISVLALFWLRTPLESWIGAAPVKARSPSEFGLVRNAVMALAAVSSVALVWLFWEGRNLPLLWIGAAAGAAFFAQAMVKRASRGNRAAAQIIGAAGLTAVAPAAWYAVTGRFNGAAWSLWVANLLFAANQIQFIQLRIRAAQTRKRQEKLAIGRGFLAAQAVLLVLLILRLRQRLLPTVCRVGISPHISPRFRMVRLRTGTAGDSLSGKARVSLCMHVRGAADCGARGALTTILKDASRSSLSAADFWRRRLFCWSFRSSPAPTATSAGIGGWHFSPY